MRTYFVRLPMAGFAAAGNVFTSPTIDLYYNDSYRNYSVTKSLYGLNSLGNETWTGLEQLTATTTDSGVIESGRFIDTSGRADIVSWWVESTFTTGEGPLEASLALYTADAPGASFPDEYVRSGPYTPSDPVEVIGAPRYFRLEVTTTAPPGAVFDFTVYLRVEIDQPVMAPKYRMTGRMLDQFPQWMALREYGIEHATPELATPTTVGAQFLNAVAGEWLEDLSNRLTYADLQKYIDSADLNQVAWVYKLSLENEPLWSFRATGVPDYEVARAADLDEFYAAVQAGEDVLWWDENDDVVYLAKNYTYVVNGREMIGALEPHHVWNSFDDIGYSVDLRRHRLESNESFQHRIRDVYRNKPGVGVDNFKLALRRELNIWKAYGATPDSQYSGATPEVLEMSDLERDPYYMAPDGMPTDRFVGLVDRLAQAYPTTWGRFRWDLAFWDIGGPNHEGFNVLPYRMDATPLAAGNIQSGVGDLDDLLLMRPDAVTGPHDFTARLIARGRQRTTRTEYPPVEFEVEIYGRSEREIYNNPVNGVWLTLDVLADDGNRYFHSFLLTARSDVDVDKPTATPASYATYWWLAEDGSGTDDNLVFARMSNGAAYGTNGTIPLEDITSVTLRAGRWDVGTQAYTLTEDADTFDAWFSNDPSTVLTFNAGAPTLTGGVTMPQPPVVMRSKQTAFVIGDWETERFPYTIRVNTATPATVETIAAIPIPDFIWDPYETDPATREVIVQLKTQDPVTGDYGANTVDETGAPVFLDASYLRFRMGSASAVTPSAATGLVVYPDFNDFTFWVEDGADYPVTATVWDLYEAAQTVPFTAVVDENGPWRYGNPSAPGNTNFVLQSMEVDRNDFGIPNTDEYVITWMGVEVLDDPRVITWLDTNTVRPAVTDSEQQYPANSIVEAINAGVYTYTPFVVRARLQLQPSPEWNPYIHSGWYYQDDREGYVYADPETVNTTGATRILPGIARQGAPIIIYTNEATPREMRQVAFMDTNGALTLTNTEVVRGSGINRLYLAYDDVYNVTVTDVASGQAVAADATTATNELAIAAATDRNKEYRVTYRVARSFFADHNYVHTDGTIRTRITLDQQPGYWGGTSYDITYERSKFDPATPVDLPLSPLYSSLSESFVFLSHNEYTLDRVEVTVSPRKVVADGSDYMLVSIRSLDRYGNPKPNASFTVTSDWGTVDDATLTTDRDGYVSTILYSEASDTETSGTLTVTGDVSASIVFEIEPVPPDRSRLLAVVANEQIPANGKATNMIYGRVENTSYVGQAAVTLNWKRARSLYELFDLPAPPAATPAGTTTFSYWTEATPVTPPAATPVVLSTTTTDDAAGHHVTTVSIKPDPANPTTSALVTTRETTVTPPPQAFAGTVVTNAQGNFEIGPFLAAGPEEPGYWFVSVELVDGTVGDVVFWNEYPDTLYGPVPSTNLPRPTMQALAGDATPYATANTFPSYYDEATPYAPATPVWNTERLIWLPPKWFALSKYLQYQLGLLGAVRGQVTYGPETREFRKVL